MQDVSGFGLSIRVMASKTFPSGITLTAFPDDTDPFDMPALQINDAAMGLNGDLITWSTQNPLQVTVAVIPGSEDDRNMAVLFERNRSARGKKSSKDVITLVGIYADGSTITLSNGIIYDGMPGKSVASGGRHKSKTYSFRFEGKAGTEAI